MGLFCFIILSVIMLIMTKKPNPIYVILDNIRSLYNVGAIFRTSDAANIAKIYICGMTGSPDSQLQIQRINKTALGAEQTVPWQYYRNPVRIINKLKKEGVKIYALENTLHATRYTNWDYQFPCALVLGHEVRGVSQKVLKLADKVISIPMYGQKESLNVEAAYAVAVYEILKQCKRTVL